MKTATKRRFTIAAIFVTVIVLAFALLGPFFGGQVAGAWLYLLVGWVVLEFTTQRPAWNWRRLIGWFFIILGVGAFVRVIALIASAV